MGKNPKFAYRIFNTIKTMNTKDLIRLGVPIKLAHEFIQNFIAQGNDGAQPSRQDRGPEPLGHELGADWLEKARKGTGHFSCRAAGAGGSKLWRGRRSRFAARGARQTSAGGTPAPRGGALFKASSGTPRAPLFPPR